MSELSSGLEGEYLQPEHLTSWRDDQIIWEEGKIWEEPPPLIEFVLEDGKAMTVINRGGWFCITGQVKSRKTLLRQAMMMSCLIEEEELNRTLHFRSRAKGEPILVFDTEQPHNRTFANRTMVHKALGYVTNIDNYYEYNLLNYTPSQRLEIITMAIKETQDKTGMPLGMLFIDQAADLMPNRDVNNEAGANNVLEHLFAWRRLTEENAGIGVVIHTNRGGINTNGKLGVLLDQKSEFTFHVKKEDDVSIATNFTRDRNVPTFHFTHGHGKIPKMMKIEDLLYY